LKRYFQITRAAELESLPLFRSLVDSACKECSGIDDETVYDLKLAVDEACTNVITHGYAGMNPGSIILSVEVEPEQVVVEIIDFGTSFEPSEAPMPDIQAALEDRPLGGFGLFFIYQTMDGVDYRITEDGNRLILTKKIQTAGKTE
jgi:anti-sigma regulatory factor (Ser/Thr protein kinase)